MRLRNAPRSAAFADDSGALLAIGRPVLREAVVGDVVGFDVERVLDDLGGTVGVVPVDGLHEEVGHGVPHTVPQLIKPVPREICQLLPQMLPQRDF
jgi:hypothetical protein